MKPAVGPPPPRVSRCGTLLLTPAGLCSCIFSGRLPVCRRGLERWTLEVGRRGEKILGTNRCFWRRSCRRTTCNSAPCQQPPAPHEAASGCMYYHCRAYVYEARHINDGLSCPAKSKRDSRTASGRSPPYPSPASRSNCRDGKSNDSLSNKRAPLDSLWPSVERPVTCEREFADRLCAGIWGPLLPCPLSLVVDAVELDA